MEGWVPFGDPSRPSKVVIEEPIEIQWLANRGKQRQRPDDDDDDGPCVPHAGLFSCLAVPLCIASHAWRGLLDRLAVFVCACV